MKLRHALETLALLAAVAEDRARRWIAAHPVRFRLLATAVLLAVFALALTGCTTAPQREPRTPYLVPPPATATAPVPQAKSSPIRVIFIRPEARDHVHP
jgi:type IV pilus biogenesis protein CpaD/CtpE